MEKKNLLPIKNSHKLIIYAKYFSIDVVSSDACGYFLRIITTSLPTQRHVRQ